MKKRRCPWGSQQELMIHYHDHEWGVPIFDDQRLFEFLILEGAQAGLSWSTILNKRENYRTAFDNFNAEKIARYNSQKLERLLQNPGIVRNRLKIQATVINAKAYLTLQEKRDSFAQFIWQFVDGKPLENSWRLANEVPTSTEESDQMSKELKKLGFKFVGTTICYAFMQAVGLVNDHLMECYRYKEVKKLYNC
jgi:DNA-3-methyladenine glycosylase I